MEIKLHQLEIVLCIAPELSFSKPAEKLGISQPGIRPNKKPRGFLGRNEVLYIRATDDAIQSTGK